MFYLSKISNVIRHSDITTCRARVNTICNNVLTRHLRHLSRY